MKIILSFPTFHKLVTLWIRQSLCTMLLSFTCSNVLDIQLFNEYVLPPVMHLENRKIYYNKLFCFSKASQMAAQTTAYMDKDIFFIDCLITWGLSQFNGTKKGIKNLNDLMN